LLHAAGSKNAASIDEAAHSGLLVAGTRNPLYRTTTSIALSRRQQGFKLPGNTNKSMS
jgi:hypothetical protein